MKGLNQVRSLFISIVFLLSAVNPSYAQGILPDMGESKKYTSCIEMSKGYISGICILKHEDDQIAGSIFNEFGISAVDFYFYIKKNKVKIISVMDMLDKWYIKKVLKKDLREVINNLANGKTEYNDNKHNLSFKFEPLKVVGN